MASELTLSLLIDEEAFVRSLGDYLITKFTSIVADMVGPVKSRVGSAIEVLIHDSEEYGSLTDEQGTLRGELGLIHGASVDPVSFVSDMINAIRNNVEVEPHRFTRSGDTFTGGLTVRVLRKNYEDVLGLAGARYVSENSHSVDWLEWLLLAGSQDIVRSHWYLNIPDVKHWSRTGMGIMAQSGGRHTWAIPGRFAGTAEGNWLTRSLRPLVVGENKSIIHVIVEQELTRRL